MFVVKAVEFRRKNYYSSNIKALGPLEGKLELLNGEGTSLNMNLTKEDADGRPVTMFRGIPVKQVDQLRNNEATVGADS